jgi:metabolite-proton symporter
MNQHTTAANPVQRILFASLIGTAIEYFDFYIYGTAAVLVFPKLFFPQADPTTATLESLATFGLAFFARPIGGALFGHFGDRIGRKATLVAALLTMGPSTVAIGLLPTYETVGILAPILLALFRFGQGLGLGGEWGGAVLLAMENAPAHKKTTYGMFPQLGAPLGLFLSSTIFLLLSNTMEESNFLQYGWRIPFLASGILVWLGLYVRLKIAETPQFLKVIKNDRRVKIPALTMLQQYPGRLVAGILAAATTFLLFYLMSVFTLSYATQSLHYARSFYLNAQILSVLFFAIGIPAASLAADRFGRSSVLMTTTVLIFLFGLFFSTFFIEGNKNYILFFQSAGMLLMGLTYGPLGTLLAEIFPAHLRYTGSSLAFNLSGIIGASLTPYIATRLANTYGIEYVGYYLCIFSMATTFALWAARKWNEE